MCRRGPRLMIAALAFALTAGCAEESYLGPPDPGSPPRTDLRRAAVRIHVDLARGTATTAPSNAPSAAAAGLSLALMGRNEIRADVVGPIRRSAVGEYSRKKVRVSMDVALTNLLTNAAFVSPTFPEPPDGTSGLLLFPFATTVTAGSGAVTPSPDWDGAPINFFNDTDVTCSLYRSDCSRWEAYPAPLTGELSTTARTVGFDVDATVTAFDTYLVLAADLSSLGVVRGFVGSRETFGTPLIPSVGARVTIDLLRAGGGSLGHRETTTGADGMFQFLDVPANSPFPPGYSTEDGDGYLIKITEAPACGRLESVLGNDGVTAVEAGRTTEGQGAIFICTHNSRLAPGAEQ